MKLSVGAAFDTSYVNRARAVEESLQSVTSIVWWMLNVSAVPTVWSIHTWTVEVITTFPGEGRVRLTEWMFVQPAIARPPVCHGELRALPMIAPPPGGPAGPAGPAGPCGPIAPAAPVAPVAPVAPGAPFGPGIARDRSSARIAIAIAATFSPIPIFPPCPGIGIGMGMGGAGIGIGCGGSGIPPPPYEGCMRGIVFTEKYIVAPGPP